MSRLLFLLLCGMPLYVNACGVHQDAGFSFVSEPGSLPIFERIIHERQHGTFSNMDKPEHFKLYSFTNALSKSDQQMSFSLFEAVKGHYSEILFSEMIVVQERASMPSSSDLLLISELDVLDALASKQLSWPDAKSQGLVRINGLPQDIAMLDKWFSDLFPSDRVN